MIWGLRTHYWVQAIRRGQMQLGRLETPMSIILQPPKERQWDVLSLSLSLSFSLSLSLSFQHHLGTSAAAPSSLARPNAAICSTELCSCSSTALADTRAELSITRLGFVRVHMGKSWPGTWLFQSQERLLAFVSAELHF